MKLLPLLLLLLATAPARAAGEAGELPWPAGAKLELQLTLQAAGGGGKVAGTLAITNPGPAAVAIQEPAGRLALAFFVSDEMGNPVVPEGLAKVDPAAQVLSLAPGATYTHHFARLAYVAGTIEKSYTLAPGKRYRVVAVYRPTGLPGPGFASSEAPLQVPP